jgi:hypothetical protein
MSLPVVSPYSYYLDLLGSWPTGIGLASQWLVHIYFNSVTNLTQNFQSIINKRESGAEWSLNSDVTSYLVDGRLQSATDYMMGCAFSRQVSLPGETIAASNEGLSYGGFQAPAVASNREKYQSLKITFLETNASFLDLVIRPWIIAVGYNGLVARQPNSLKRVKADAIDVVMFAKSGAYNPMQIRKLYRFYNVAPVSMGGETYSYSEEGLRYSDVSFVYDKYAVGDGATGNLISLP